MMGITQQQQQQQQQQQRKWAMASVLPLLPLLLLQTMLLWWSSGTSAAQPQGFLSLDCGSQLISSYNDTDTRLEWSPDSGLMKEGQTLPVTGYQAPYTSMRLFAGNETKYCYTLANSAIAAGRFFLVRASFWQGSDPPYTPAAGIDGDFLFKLLVDADEWANVSIPYNNSDVLRWEMYVCAQRSSIDVCVARVSAHGDAPFISALELRPLPSSLTPTQLMASSDRHFLLMTRIDNGISPSTPYTTRYPADQWDRIWTPVSGDPSLLLSTTSPVSTSKLADMAPSIVLRTSFGGTPDTNPSISWSFTTNRLQANDELYAIIYFAEIDPAVNASGQRVFNILLSGEKVVNDQPIDVFAAVGPNAGFEFVAGPFRSGPPSLDSTTHIVFYFNAISTSLLSPFMAAAELFKVTNTNVSAGTTSSDVMAIEDLKTSMNLSSYTGDPCLPTGYSYSWVTCTNLSASTASPNIKSISLSNKLTGGDIPTSINTLVMLEQLLLDGNNLQGSIPDLSALTRLETLDLSNNKLTGSIPETLVSLKNLKVLLLQNNNLTGQIPPGLLSASLIFNFSGNPLCQTSDTCSSSPSPSPLCQTDGTCSASPSRSNSKSASSAIIGGVIAASVISVAICVALFYCCKRRSRSIHIPPTRPINKPLQTLSIREFTWQEIKAATNNFSNQIGEGGFGPVYRGTLSNGCSIAVKVASSSSRQGSKEFMNEVELLSRIHHKNLVGLVGYCSNGMLVLVYEFMSRGSLYDHLHGKYAKASPLSWARRLTILIDAAEGMDYLHSGCSPRIIHRDIKSSNILLNDDMEAKISDFGISRNTLVNQTSAPSTAIMGSMGYMDPEYLATMKLTEKADVYSFGILLLEVVCGRPVFFVDGHNERIHILAWAKSSIEKGVVEDIVDASLHNRYDVSSVWKVLETALECLELSSSQRPKMSMVCSELKEAERLELESQQRGVADQPYTSLSEGGYMSISLTDVQAR